MNATLRLGELAGFLERLEQLLPCGSWRTPCFKDLSGFERDVPAMADVIGRDAEFTVASCQ